MGGAAGTGPVVQPPNQSGAGGGLTLPPPSQGKGEGCQTLDVTFEPKIPTVFVLVDRSGSMFRDEPMPWYPLKEAVLQVVNDLQADIRFGFGAFTGEVGEECPMFDQVNADLNNYGPIKTLYDQLMEPTKGETPSVRALALVRDLLVSDPTDGEKYILFVTDGEPDYCGDGNPLCPVDGVVYQLQELYEQGIKTFVFGLQTVRSAVPASTLQAWANAGAGEPVAYLQRDNQVIQPIDIFYQCNPAGDPNSRGWKEDHTAAGRPMNEPLGVYAQLGGTAPVFTPDASNRDLLVAQIRSVVGNVKSCTFDLQGKIQVNLDQASLGKVQIDGMPVPYDPGMPSNGWRMATATQLVLEGAACEQWRETGVNIAFDFPCEIIIK